MAHREFQRRLIEHVLVPLPDALKIRFRQRAGSDSCLDRDTGNPLHFAEPGLQASHAGTVVLRGHQGISARSLHDLGDLPAPVVHRFRAGGGIPVEDLSLHVIAQDLIELRTLDHLDHHPRLRLRLDKGPLVKIIRGLGAKIVQAGPAVGGEIPVQVDAGRRVLPLVQVPDIFVRVVKDTPGRPALKDVVDRVLHLLRLHAVHAVLRDGDTVGIDHRKHVETDVLQHLVARVSAVQKILHLAHDDRSHHIFPAVHGRDHQDLSGSRGVPDDCVPEFPAVRRLPHGAAVEAGNALQTVQVRRQLVIGIHARPVEIVAADLGRDRAGLVFRDIRIRTYRSRRSRACAVHRRVQLEIRRCIACQHSRRHCGENRNRRDHKRACGRPETCRSAHFILCHHSTVHHSSSVPQGSAPAVRLSSVSIPAFARKVPQKTITILLLFPIAPGYNVRNDQHPGKKSELRMKKSVPRM